MRGFDLQRFIDAQAGVYEQALAEVAAGRKRSHWMWFVFPQLRGLGSSRMAETYAIASLEEARAYLAHPLLGPRLAEITQALLSLEGASAQGVFGTPDDLKLRSSLTLFVRAAEGDGPYAAALTKYFGGVEDEATLRLL